MKDIVVIGAGACGLSAARVLAEQGHRVSVLEARDRIGGRIHTVHAPFSLPVDAGAEFVHGDQPLTNAILNESGNSARLLAGKRYQLWNGILKEADFFENGWKELMAKLDELKEDIDMNTFINRYFGDGKYGMLRRKVSGFVEGFDAADMERVSALALRQEWSGSDDEHYHVEARYAALTDFLGQRVKKAGGTVVLSSPVTEIHWHAGKAKVVTSHDRNYYAEKVIVTIPLGLLQTDALKFFPAIPTYEKAFQSMGFGGVAKFLFEFKSAFWQTEIPEPLKDLAFIFSDAEVPTWWSQLPEKTPLLTGWLGGPGSRELPASKDLLLEKALQSLAYIFGYPVREIIGEISRSDVVNWVRDPWARGAYAYPTTETRHALKLVREPLDDTVYFAGEAIYDGPAIGTVEAALSSGKDVAARI